MPTAPLPPLDRIAAETPVEKIPALIAMLAARLLAERAPSSNGSAPATVETDTWLTVPEAARLLRRKPRWVWRHKNSLPFVRRVGARGLLVSRHGLEMWIAEQRIR